MRVKLGVALLLLLLTSGIVSAQGVGAVRKQAESSLLITGAIEIDQAGRLAHMTIDQREALPPGVVNLVETASSSWRFEPVVVDGRAVRAKGPMTLRVVASRIDEDNYRIQLRSATFGSDNAEAGETINSVKMGPPHYPESAARSGVSGTVYLLLRIGRDGRVDDVAAEQTNLTVVAREQMMKTFRGMLERASVAAARKWTFAPPTTGPQAGADHWVVRVPVDYYFDVAKPKYGAWASYIPGPRAIVLWANPREALAGADAMSEGSLYQLGTGLRLLTPLGPG